FGGFVKITGMNPDELEPAPATGEPPPKQGLLATVEGAGEGRPREQLPPEVLERAYYKQPVWKRIVVIGAGPAMNVLLAFVILFAIGLGLAGGLRQVNDTVGDISAGTPAAAHLQTGDEILAIVGISDVTHQAFQFGAREALVLIALFSFSLALITLFPLLPLDGGHIFWSLVEKVRGQPVPFGVMERAGVIGFVLVMVLFAIGLSNDINRLTGPGFSLR